jgi:methylated-DNA-[protein]-cysteine S-methyltransferase
MVRSLQPADSCVRGTIFRVRKVVRGRGVEDDGSMIELLVDRVDSPVGTLLLVSDGRRLCALDFHDYAARMERLLRARYGEYRLRDGEAPAGVSSALRAYFGGDAGAVDAIEADTGGTPFQREVWVALREIPAGTTETYGALARRIGKPSGARAVGITNALNPIAIVVPCHRLIGANATLTGYAGGLHRKDWLLRHEGVDIRDGKKIAPPPQLSFLG